MHRKSSAVGSRMLHSMPLVAKDKDATTERTISPWDTDSVPGIDRDHAESFAPSITTLATQIGALLCFPDYTRVHHDTGSWSLEAGPSVPHLSGSLARARTYLTVESTSSWPPGVSSHLSGQSQWW